MVNKVISSVILTTSVVFLALANSQPDNLLFLFLSPNELIGISRVVLGVGMVLLSFKGLLSNARIRQAVKYGGLSLMAFGVLCMLITPLSSALYDYLKLLDIMIVAEAGVIFTSCALSIPQAYIAGAKRKAAHRSLNLRQRAA
jgi:hypothetical protein